MLQKVHFASNQEVAASVHKHLCVYLRRILFEHKRCVKDRDRLKPEGVAASESEELQIYLGKLNVEFTEVADVIQEQSLAEV